MFCTILELVEDIVDVVSRLDSTFGCDIAPPICIGSLKVVIDLFCAIEIHHIRVYHSSLDYLSSLV